MIFAIMYFYGVSSVRLVFGLGFFGLGLFRVISCVFVDRFFPVELTPRLRQSYLTHLPKERRGKWEVREWGAIRTSSARW
jgi:hypothetical protein